MQFENGQSRIGASLWEQPQLYFENSPLFHLPRVTTPLFIMPNDATARCHGTRASSFSLACG